MITRQPNWLCGVSTLLLLCLGAQAGRAEVKNVILLIGDGTGYNCWRAGSMYQGRWNAVEQRGTQVYDGPGWVAYGCSTYPLTTSAKPTKKNVQDPLLVYDPQKAWSTAPATETVKVNKVAQEVALPAGYKWLKGAYTDSAAAASALATGQKTFDAAINWSDLDTPLGPTISELAKARGKAVGLVTSVQWSHATPAGLSHAHVVDRDKYEEIATQMLAGGTLDVIMGAGNPDFDDNGKPRRKNKVFKYVGGEPTWKAIEAARATPDGLYQGFRPVSSKAEFEALCAGPVPRRVLGTAQIAQTLQQARRHPAPPAKKGLTAKEAEAEAEKETEKELARIAAQAAYKDPFVETVPSLTTMAQGALHVLERNPQGLFLMVEGGAIDWANHKNQPGRMLEETLEFIRTIEAVVAWVESHSNWNETLVIITADHETGLLWGSNSNVTAFDPVSDKGAGQMPGLRYNWTSHTNSLVPLFAKGTGSGTFAELVVGTDPVRGPYVTNTAVFEAMRRAITPTRATPAEKKSAE